MGCCTDCTVKEVELCSMEIGRPTNVRHVAHVTFDRFNGFLGLPVEFEPELPRRAPSARFVASVFFFLNCNPMLLALFCLRLCSLLFFASSTNLLIAITSFVIFPSCSASVFGVSTESMQCSYDSRGNSVPTILLLMQRRLYCLGGLQVCMPHL